MDILVTGGSGFIGTNFIQYILDKYNDYRIINVDKAITQIEEQDKYRFYQIDISNNEELLKLFKFWYGFDIVINLAELDDINSVTTLYNLLEIIKKFKVKKFLQISTNRVYEANDQRSTEESILKPKDLYSVSKASCDLVALSYFSSFEVPVVVSRSSELFGPYQNREKFVPAVILSVLLKQPVLIHKNIYRDWLNVLDYCRVLDTLMHYGKPGQIYNVCGAKTYKELDIATLILESMEQELSVLEEARDILENTPFLDCSKFKTEFNWKLLMETKEGLQDVIEWYKDNQDWCLK